MINVNIKQLIGNLIVVTTPETLEQDLEAKISAVVLRVIQSVQVQDLGHAESNLDKSDPQ